MPQVLNQFGIKMDEQSSSLQMPALFVGHGSPMNLIEANSYTDSLARLGRELPRPKAIVVISAHWQTQGVRVLKASRPETIYDFYGFPDELYRMQYPAPGDERLAEDLAQMMRVHDAQTDQEWGLDHGTWAVLHHMYPDADIPVLQLSLNRSFHLEDHLRAASDLKALRRQGVLILGSGNITHNLRDLSFAKGAPVFPWALEFDELIGKALQARDLHQILAKDSTKHSLWKHALPTLEHYLPLLYVLGVSDESDELSFPYEGFQAASLSMRSVQWSAS